MSDLMPTAETLECPSGPVVAPVIESYPAREASVGGGLVVRRLLPRSGRRLVGPWCFFDHFGPLTFGAGKPMDVAPHPHIGLQTVTWLMEGEVLHRDSLGTEQLIRPGQLNLMTAGRGIAHSEETPRRHSGRLHGLQLWVALSEASRQNAPHFDHVPELPALALGACQITVLAGELHGVRSPATTYSRMVGAQVTADHNDSIALPIDPRFEHALVPIEGPVALGDRMLEPDALYYLGAGREELELSVTAGARFVLLGGEPFGETILMWWNFVARTPEEIVAARDDWEQGRRFGAVHAYAGERIPAPALAVRLKRPN